MTALAWALIALSLCSLGAVVALALVFGGRVLAALEAAEKEHRLERAAMMRALMARNGAEYGQLDRIAGQGDQRRNGIIGEPDPRRQITAEEYQAMLRADLEAGLGSVGDSPVLEGF